MENLLLEELPENFGGGVKPGDIDFKRYCFPGHFLTPNMYANEVLARLVEYSIYYEKWVGVSYEEFCNSIYEERKDFLKKKSEFESLQILKYNNAMSQYEKDMAEYEKDMLDYAKQKEHYQQAMQIYSNDMVNFKKDFRRYEFICGITFGIYSLCRSKPKEPKLPQKPIIPEEPIMPSKPDMTFRCNEVKTVIHYLPSLCYEAFNYFEQESLLIENNGKHPFIEKRNVFCEGTGKEELFIFPTESLVRVLAKKNN
jgi:hypothetical protein